MLHKLLSVFFITVFCSANADDSLNIDAFLNAKVAHERENETFFGSRNTSACGLNPVITIGNVVLESDFYYGRQFSYTSALRGIVAFIGMIPSDQFKDFGTNFPTYKKKLTDPMSNGLDKPHFYRNFSRAIISNDSADFKVIIGDAAVKNTIGFQNSKISGVGINIYRQGGNGLVKNGGSPIVITRLSKLECKLAGDILAVEILKPGIYTIEDLPEEAKLPGATIKISDQLGRAEKINVSYFSGYDTPEAGKDDFDLSLLYGHKWDIADPHRLKYEAKPRFNGNYRCSVDSITMYGFGSQYYDNNSTLDATMIFTTNAGKFSPNVGMSTAKLENGKRKDALGFGMYYAVPENELGLSMELFAAYKGKGYGDAGRSKNDQEMYNDYINKYFSTDELKQKFQNSSLDSKTKQFTARLFTKEFHGIRPVFVFNGVWTNSSRLREYTLALTSKISESFLITVSGGLTYDQPYGGRNLRSPDKRLTIAGTLFLGKEVKLQSSFHYYDDEKRRIFASLSYTPEEIKGLELTTESTNRPSYGQSLFAVRYNCEYFNFKVDQATTNKHKNQRYQIAKDDHKNRQRGYFGTRFTTDGMKSYMDTGYNIIKDFRKKK